MAAGGGSNQDVAVAVQVELSGAESAFGDLLPSEVYERTWRMLVPRNDTPSLPSLFEHAWSVGDEDMTQPETLTSFLDWAQAAVPARHHAPIVWDHGGGWSGIAIDDGSGHGNSDFMSLVC